MHHLAPVTMPAKAVDFIHTIENMKENLPQSVVELVDLVVLHVKALGPEA